MNKNFVKIIFIVALFVGTFFASGRVKAINCCLLEGQSPSCHLYTVSTPCKTEKTIRNCDPESGNCGPDLTIPGEKSVNCPSFPICMEALTRELKDCNSLQPTDCVDAAAICFWSTNSQKCLSLNDVNQCPNLSKDDCRRLEKAGCKWEGSDKDGQCKGPLSQALGEQYQYSADRYKLLPSCAIDGSCRSLSNILDTILRATNLIFKYIGAIAFIFFIIGGFTMILSFGNAEKFKKGQQILVAAVIGLLIVFGAYLIISFVVEALGIGAEFKVLK